MSVCGLYRHREQPQPRNRRQNAVSPMSADGRSFRKDFCNLRIGSTVASTTMTWPVEKPPGPDYTAACGPAAFISKARGLQSAVLVLYWQYNDYMIAKSQKAFRRAALPRSQTA